MAIGDLRETGPEIMLGDDLLPFQSVEKLEIGDGDTSSVVFLRFISCRSPQGHLTPNSAIFLPMGSQPPMKHTRRLFHWLYIPRHAHCMSLCND